MNLFQRHSNFKSPRTRKRGLRFETLETRNLLAVGGSEMIDFRSAAGDQIETISFTGAVTSSSTDIDISNLNSNPGSMYTLYLDFDGHVTSGTSWNRSYNHGRDIVSPRFALDGNTSKTYFTDAEKEAIYEIWLRVAEDYMPFDINVTTCEPSAADFNAGRAQRIVIGGSWSDWYGSGAGGVSWVGSFTQRSDNPNFAFTENLYGNVKYIAECVSHELGHSLGLSHKGNKYVSGKSEYYDGTDGWAPIMGAGYYEELTQWSKGEYYGASNTYDELQTLTSRNGFGYRQDDYGNTFEDAAYFDISAGTMSGIIERNTDIDCFRFESDGISINFTIGGIKNVTNLDTLVKVYDADYTLLEVYDPTDSLSVEFTFSEGPGTYYLTVEGTGRETSWQGIYSDYGSLGAYTIQADYSSVIVVTTLSDTVDDDREISLREAVLLAGDQSVIQFAPSLSGGVIELAEGEILLDRSVRIDASNLDKITIDARQESRIFNVSETVILAGLALTNGYDGQNGAAVYNGGTLTLIDCDLNHSSAEYGGAIYNDIDASAELICCTLNSNTANYGGAIYNDGILILDSTDITDSAAYSSNGGAVYNTGILTATDSVFLYNSAQEDWETTAGGGAVYNETGAIASFISTLFLENSASFGGVVLNAGTCSFDDVTCNTNTALNNFGGAVYNIGTFTALNSTFNDCSTVYREEGTGGGAIYNGSEGTAEITQSLFYRNAAHYGGAILNAGTLHLAASTITQNSAANGGGVLNSGVFDAVNTILAGNTAASGNSDLDADGGTITGTHNLSTYRGWLGDGNLEWNGTTIFPLADQDDFTPAPESQAVDAGSNDLTTLKTDINGGVRIYNKIVDIGAAECTTRFLPKLFTPEITELYSMGRNRHLLAWTPISGAVTYEVTVTCGGETRTAATGETSLILENPYGAEAVYTVRAIGDPARAKDSDPSDSRSLFVCPSDIDGDGFIGPGDFAYMSVLWFALDDAENWDPRCDVDGDGFIGPGDFAFLSVNWMKFTDDSNIVNPL